MVNAADFVNLDGELQFLYANYPNGCGNCTLDIPTFTPSTTPINAAAGETTTLAATIADSSGKPVRWTLTIEGNTYSGSGNSVAVTWDGKDSSGRILDDGVYTATLHAETEDGACTDDATLPIEVKNEGMCLSVPFGSTANFATGNLTHQQELPGAAITLHYNSLDSHNGPLGRGWRHSYDIALIRQPDGSMLLRKGNGQRTFYRYENGVYHAPPGEYSILAQRSDGYTLTRKGGEQYVFNADGILTALVDRNANATRFAYAGNLASITDPVGRVTSFQYDGFGHLARIVTPAGNVYGFTVAGDTLASVVMPDGSTWRYAYDATGFLTSRTDAAGHVTTYAYDARHRVVSATDPQGQSRSIAYSTENGPEKMATLTEKDGAIRRFVFDAHHGNLLAKADPDGNLTSTTHDANHNQTSITDAGGTVTMTYDSQGNMLSRTDQLGHTTRFTYNNLGQPTSSTDPLGATTFFTYDAHGNLLAATDPTDSTTRYAYDAMGRLVSVTNATGQTTRLAYDSHGNIASRADADGATTTMTHDVSGNLLTITGPEGQVSSFAYEAMNRLVAAQDPLGHTTRYAYDAVGNLLTATDANANTTSHAYDAMGRLAATTDARGGVTRIQYDAAGNPASLTDPNGHTTTMAHDAMGRLVRETDPLGNQTSLQYDGVGRLASRTDAMGNTIRYAYDAAGRLLTKTTPDNSSSSFAYNAAGRITQAVNPAIGYSLAHDAAGRLLSITDTNNRTFTYQYDAAGNRTRMTLPDNTAQGYTYDQANRLSRITSFMGAFSFGYDANGRRASLGYPNTVATRFDYDDAGRLTGVAAANNLGDPMAVYAYTHDATGNRTARASLLRNDTYAYDPTSQLTRAVKQLLDDNGAVTKTQRENYSYDPVGNRQTGLRPPIPAVYDPANQLLSSKQFTYTYDANGNLTGKAKVMPVLPDDDQAGVEPEQVPLDPDGDSAVGVSLVQPPTSDTRFAYDWDAENRLVKVVRTTPKQVTTTSFTYDPFGRRVEKRVETTNVLNARTSVVIHTYLYDQEDMVREIVTKPRPRRDIVEETTYVHGPGLDEPLAFSGPRGEYFMHPDGLGSISALTDHTGAVAQRYEYSVFGVRKKYDAGVDTAYGFTGREWDSETGLYYYRARYYDPQAGRFISRDPIGFNGGDVNVYRYVSNNPVNAIDPSGLFSQSDINRAWSHYCDGTRTSWTTSLGSLNWGDSRSWIRARIAGMVGQSGTCQATTIPVSFDIGGQTSPLSADGVIVGRHVLRVVGQLTINCDCSWTFTGNMSSAKGYDPYDFNSSNRGPIGEALTWAGRNRCPQTGTTFNINITGSEALSFSGDGPGGLTLGGP